ncbi:MAG: SEC-C metal-binding domain-containing protein [Kofleriaceae bacterium]
MASVVVTSEDVERTIAAFTRLDQRGDKKAMNKLATRLQREQPFLLQYAAQLRTAHTDIVGEAAVFYATLVWAMFDRTREATLPRLTQENLADAEKVVTEALAAVPGLDELPPNERMSEVLSATQPHVYGKLRELLTEDVKEEAMTAETCAAIGKPIQVIVEAFDAALTGRRPGAAQGTVVAAEKTGRNEPCPCGSGKKYKKCHGGVAA